MKISLLVAKVVSLVVFPVFAATSGDIAESLRAKLTSAPSDSLMTVVIAFKNGERQGALKKELNAAFRTFGERYRYGLEKLQRAAKEKQGDLLGRLRSLEQKGQARNIKSHWIINVVAAEVAVSELEGLASDREVAEIFELPQVSLIEPEDGGAAPYKVGGVETNVTALKADSAWKLGLTGKGRIICSFDTGIQGTHPALIKNWKGHDGDSSAAWFDPIGQQSFPHTFGTGNSYEHGTHTMGIMVGHDDSTGDTIGVALEAKWISAAVIDIVGASIIDAFEWAANPDGDLNTISDIPDVINHSWGISNVSIGCHEYFWEMIENTEALGIVNIFAAGNSGPNPLTIVNPANRAFDSLDCFAVGNINHQNDTISANSSRGPSDCDGISIKPNVVAPGYNIRSSVPNNYYKYKFGTSMAAPHISGAVAILRQYAPNATPDEIKEALLESCRPILHEGVSPNNVYGWGFVDIPLALEKLTPPDAPVVRVYSFVDGHMNPGDTVRGTVFLKNYGIDVSQVTGRVTVASPGLELQTPLLSFGDIKRDSIAGSQEQLIAVIADTVVPGTLLSLNMMIYGSMPPYITAAKIYLQVGEIPRAGYYTHQSDVLRFTISNLGQFGFAGGSMLPLGYSGFRYVDFSRNDMYEGALMIGTDPGHVSDGARNIAEEPDNDFAVAPGGSLIVMSPGAKADQETYSVFNDSRAEFSLGLTVSQRTLGWLTAPDNNYVILEYRIINSTDTALPPLYAGLFFDWDIYNYTYNRGGYDEATGLGYMYYYFNAPSRFRGAAVINPEGATGFKLRHNPPASSLNPLFYSEGEKFANLTSSPLTHDSSGDWSMVLSTGPFALGGGDSCLAVFAVMAADNLNGLKETATRAKNRYFEATDYQPYADNLLPERFDLGQNYPNPFNPGTVISFALKSREKITLSVYNILGAKVARLVEDELAAGNYTVYWDGTDDRGKPVASGVYFYQLRTPQGSQTRKMVMVK
ncbi:MAG: S8 family serine peptidase [bacterium]|jgi:subtilisin family serine protease